MKYNPREILNSEGALLTPELASEMSRKHHVSIAAAKKGIDRACKKGMIKRIEFMTFGSEYISITLLTLVNLISFLRF